MKKFLISTALATALVATGAAFAQTTSAQTTTGQGMFRTKASGTEVLASDFIGLRVYASETKENATEYNGVQQDWNDVGEINDVILSRDGMVDSVLVDIGGFLGMGERQIAIAMDSVAFVGDSATGAADDYFLVISATLANLKDAPEYSMFTLGDRASRSTSADTAATDTTRTDTATIGTAPMIGSTAANRTAFARDGYATAEAETLTAEKLTGVGVYDSQDKRVGEVSELTLTNSGDVDKMIVDIGGFLGMGEKSVALALDQVDILRETANDSLRVYVAISEDQMKALPTFDK